MKYPRKEVRERLTKTLKAGRPVIAAGAGIGLSRNSQRKAGRIWSSFTIPGVTG